MLYNNSNKNKPERALVVCSDVKDEPRAGVGRGALILCLTVAWPFFILFVFLFLFYFRRAVGRGALILHLTVAWPVLLLLLLLLLLLWSHPKLNKNKKTKKNTPQKGHGHN